MSLTTTYFDNTQLLMLGLAGFFFLASLFFQTSKRYKLSFVFLGLTAFFLFSFAALLDPFLNIWDERFHALVAKNLMNHPLMPTLYDDPVVDMLYDRWDRWHVWLHKQPLFLWQIALSFKLFGISEFTLRLPNIVLSTVLVMITYRSGRLLVNHKVGFLAGTLLLSTMYITELVAGRQSLEHNDIAFLAYVSLSIWSFIEYYYSNNKRWIILIGLFSGMAILCKWLVGLLVYLGWFILRVQQKKYSLPANKDLITAFLITVIIAAPWQILTFLWYPSEAAHALEYNSLHFTVPIEGHRGDFWYHFDVFNTIYGRVASFLIVPSFYVLMKWCNDKKLYFSLLGMVLAVFLFFSLAATKMPSFTLAVAMLVFIAFAALFYGILEFIAKYVKSKGLKVFIFIASVLIITLLKYDIEVIQENHTLWKESNTHTRMMMHNKAVFQSLELPANTVLFNVRGRHYIEAMFYTGLPAYSFLPSIEQYEDMKSKNRKIAVFKPVNLELPIYLADDTEVITIDTELQGYY
jgi:4-amino-4-deoxy-L-arabinose transferase